MLTSDGLIDYVFSMRYENLPNDVIVAAKRLIMNTFCAILCGSRAKGVREIEIRKSKKEEGTLYYGGFNEYLYD